MKCLTYTNNDLKNNVKAYDLFYPFPDKLVISEDELKLYITFINDGTKSDFTIVDKDSDSGKSIEEFIYKTTFLNKLKLGDKLYRIEYDKIWEYDFIAFYKGLFILERKGTIFPFTKSQIIDFVEYKDWMNDERMEKNGWS